MNAYFPSTLARIDWCLAKVSERIAWARLTGRKDDLRINLAVADRLLDERNRVTRGRA